MIRLKKTLAYASFMGILCIGVQPLLAQTGETLPPDPDSGTGTVVEESGVGNIEIEQVTPLENVYSEWTLIKPDNQTVQGRHMHQMFADTPIGNYSIMVDPLQGATATVTIMKNDEVLAENEFARATFSVESDDEIKITITNVFTRIGTVSVQSEPPGVEFKLIGPNTYEITGTTPAEYLEMPEGLYTATFYAIEGCFEEQSRSDRLQKDSRITLSLTISCEGMENLIQIQEQQKSLVYVTATIDGELVSFTDVFIDEWFASYVHNSLKTGIMSGYRDADGTITGEFGPQDNVTLAQLAKIAHETASIDESKVHTRPTNLRAQGTWFEQYFASAEKLGWLVFADKRLNPGRNATRSEVVATLLQALDVPRYWSKGEMFTDVRMTTPFSSSIETAAIDGIVSGSTDEEGDPTGEFRPDDPINRAEMAKIVSLSIELYKEDTWEIQPDADD